MTFFGRADPLSVQARKAKLTANKHGAKPEPKADRGTDRPGRNPVKTQYVSTAPVTLATPEWLAEWKRREGV